ncbi:histidine kinase [Pelagicoccus enzymogenes]|uniref:histidine kinase n=1 Tax=Pelagicoccus enzymogenes TaxID=2773457 RepID=UPI00280CFF53|nr:histidine kinase [Pelagicoccus enzymogenes]MDQ8200631.1 histidine kinase [Pelagicoccus enzymogenes]
MLLYLRWGSLFLFGLSSLSLLEMRGKSLNALDREISAIEAQLKLLPVREPGEMGGTAGIYVERQADSSSSITVDLGEVFPIDLIALLPTRMQNVEREMEQVGFPSRFEILGSVSEDFREPVVLYSGRENDFPDPSGYPALFDGEGAEARYVRIEVHDFPQVRMRRAASFAELFVFSNGQNVASGRPVEASDSISWEGLFDASFLVDGQTTFGQPILSGEKMPRSRGWHAAVRMRADKKEFVELHFNTAQKIHGVHLYPVYHSLWPNGTDYGFPSHFRLEVREPDKGWRTVEDWSERVFPPPGNSPVYFSIESLEVDAVRLLALRLPESIPSRFIFALAEIEVFSDGNNISREAKVVSSSLHTFNLEEWNEEALIDGYATRGKILPLQEWLKGLALRGQLEERLALLFDQRSEKQKEFTQLLRIVVTVLSMTLLFVAGLLIRNRSIRQKQMLDLRNQIAADLHDDVGSNLASITILAAGAREQCSTGTPQAIALERLVDIAKETSASMRDIVWMLHPVRKSNISLTARLKDIASRLLAETEFTFEGSKEVGADALSMEKLHHFLLFYKETLHNLARHGNATHVRISLGVLDKNIHLRISDDGNRPEAGKLPEGLKLRAEKLSAALSYRSVDAWNELTLIV